MIEQVKKALDVIVIHVQINSIVLRTFIIFNLIIKYFNNFFSYSYMKYCENEVNQKKSFSAQTISVLFLHKLSLPMLKTDASSHLMNIFVNYFCSFVFERLEYKAFRRLDEIFILDSLCKQKTKIVRSRVSRSERGILSSEY